MEFEMKVLILGAKKINFKVKETNEVISGTRIYFAQLNNDKNVETCGYIFDENNGKSSTYFANKDLDLYEKVFNRFKLTGNKPFESVANYEIKSASKLPKLVNIKI